MTTRPAQERSDPAPDPRWLSLVERLRAGEVVSFEEQWALFRRLADRRPAESGPLPAWVPEPERVAASNLAAVQAELGVDGYRALHELSVRHRERFWEHLMGRLGVVFARPPARIRDPSGGPTDPRWLPGAQLNIAQSCLGGPPERPAVVTAAEDGGGLEATSHGELAARVRRFAAALAAAGVGAGDGVALYMPMTRECVVSYLGTVLAGAHVVGIADSLPPPEIRRRLAVAGAAVVVTQERFTRAGKEVALYERLVAADAPRAVVVGAGGSLERPGDVSWEGFLAAGREVEAPVATGPPGRTTNVLFSSGTTGEPKAIPWTHLTPLKSAADAHLHLDVGSEDVLAWPTNVGWMMGPWLIYAALLSGATVALYEGTPAGSGFCRFVEQAGVTMLGVVPSLVRAWRASGAADGTDWSGVRVFASTGEPAKREDALWLMGRTAYRAPVIEYCGGTEIGGGYLTGTVVQPASPATFTTPALGLDLVILDADGEPAEEGEVFLVPPSMGLSERLLNRDHEAVYHRGCPRGPGGEVLRRHGDRLERLGKGYYRAQGRSDDTMNLGGVKVASLEIERAVTAHPAVYEAAAVAVQPEGEGSDRLVLFVVPDGEPPERDRLARQLGSQIADELSPLFKVWDVVVSDRLPRTTSNKLQRRTLRDTYRPDGP